MSALLRAVLFASLVAIAVSCGSPSSTPPPDAGQPTLDSGFAPDASQRAQDAGSSDAGSVDAGPRPGVPLPGFGTLSGECGYIDTELTDPSPCYFENHLDFGADPYDAGDLSRLTDGGQIIMTTPNAGGSSIPSEAFSFEVMTRCELATFLKGEMEVTYTNPSGKRTDELVAIDGLKVGVSVTRAMKYPITVVMTEAEAKTLIERKLSDILLSTANVAPSDKWTKQILHVFAVSQENANAVRAAWQSIDAGTRADTIVLVTVTDGDDAFLY
jgi:hypothetical protein